MLRATRSLFVARSFRLLQAASSASSRALGKGVTNPNIVGAGQKPIADPAGSADLEFGQNKNESAVFRQAGGAWDTMRKVGTANPVESSIERWEERYQTEGTGAVQQQQQESATPSLWERAKEAVTAVKDSISANAEKVKDAATHAKDSLSQKMDQASEDMSEKYASAKETVADKYQSAKEVVGEKIDDIKDSVQNRSQSSSSWWNESIARPQAKSRDATTSFTRMDTSRSAMTEEVPLTKLEGNLSPDDEILAHAVQRSHRTSAFHGKGVESSLSTEDLSIKSDFRTDETTQQRSDRSANLGLTENLFKEQSRTVEFDQGTKKDLRNDSQSQFQADSESHRAPPIRDDITGKVEDDWEEASDSIRNSTDGMGTIQQFSPGLSHGNQMNRTAQNKNKTWNTESEQASNANWNAANASLQPANQKWDEAKNAMKESWNETKEKWSDRAETVKENFREQKEAASEKWDDTKSVLKEGFQEAGKQLKRGVRDIKGGVQDLGQEVRSTVTASSSKGRNANDIAGMAKPSRIEESYEELHNAPPDQTTKAAADRLTDNEPIEQSMKRHMDEQSTSPETSEQNTKVPKKNPTTYGDYQYGGRATDF